MDTDKLDILVDYAENHWKEPKCTKCGGRYYKTPICKECGFIPLIEFKNEKVKSVLKELIAELPIERQEFYHNRLKEMGVL